MEPKSGITGPMAVEDFTRSADRAFDIGIHAFIWGYPLVVLGRARRLMTVPSGGARLLHAPINRFGYMTSLFSPDDHLGLRPNVDTLMASAWLDLHDEPLVLSLPRVADRYYSLQLLDAYGGVFAALGRRTTGNGPHSYVLAGPGWDAPVPTDMELIRAPTPYVWALGRMFVNGEIDVQYASPLLRQFAVLELSDFTGKPRRHTHAMAPTTPLHRIQDLQLEGLAFFDELSTLLETTPVPRSHAALVASFEQVGVGKGRVPSTEIQDVGTRAGLEAALRAGEQLIDQRTQSIGMASNGWRVGVTAGRYDDDYLLRAATCRMALGAQLAEEALYLWGRVDENDQAFSGAHRYVLHFDAKALPPTDAFWTLTLYDSEGYLFDNPLDRYSLGSKHEGLAYNVDGSLDIIIQADAPERGASNWLPAPTGSFSLILRVYEPKSELLQGVYDVPAVRRRD